MASISLKMIEPIVKLHGRTICHGGDLEYIEGVRDLGADFLIEVSPNIEYCLLGNVAKLGNLISSLVILKKDYLAPRQSQRATKQECADLRIQLNLSLHPMINPLSFSKKNVNYYD